MAISALVAMDCDRIVGLMAADTEWGVEYMTGAGERMVDMEVRGRCALVLMTIQAIDGRLVGVQDHHRNCGPGWLTWVNVTGSVMTGGTKRMMGSEDIRPVLY